MPAPTSELVIGLMSGTSLDGVDGALVDFSGMDTASGPRLQVRAFCSLPMPPALRAELLQLNTPGPNELHRAALAGNALARLYAQAVDQLLQAGGVPAPTVRAVGVHGQTVRHRPGEFDGTGYTVQLNQGALLAELCGMDVVADFRSRDVAAGGQGAPLVPPFHQAVFGSPSEARAVLNIGGISNITVLDATAAVPVMGFDCGPGNALMDSWCQTHTGAAFDADGQWARSGRVHATLLQRLASEPFFQRPAPKSTGRDLFNRDWLQAHLEGVGTVAAVDVQATLTELTAQSCAHSLRQTAPACQTLLVCGGGAYNGWLMERLQQHLPHCRVATTAELGLPPQQVEACAFAWLARQHLRHQPASLKSVTGAQGARILGCLYPA